MLVSTDFTITPLGDLFKHEPFSTLRKNTARQHVLMVGREGSLQCLEEAQNILDIEERLLMLIKGMHQLDKLAFRDISLVWANGKFKLL